VALQATGEAGKYLGVGIANMISILDPEMIVVGGRLSMFGEELLEQGAWHFIL
jgi:predicted NBD/HSP70 family sugar kinase